ncbi:hypothetical protein PR048_001936 [Dryococelus australis]|uniref:Uncharacterized protein n=1 Tax=Dryococelus australis TaxID=614101 RepID=A0ABQ9IIV5_9NEOP|nr:hypothetical protein PR048_001936 [Dryococelus australis]
MLGLLQPIPIVHNPHHQLEMSLLLKEVEVWWMAQEPQRELLQGRDPLWVTGFAFVVGCSFGRTSLLRRLGGLFKTNLGGLENRSCVCGYRPVARSLTSPSPNLLLFHSLPEFTNPSHRYQFLPQHIPLPHKHGLPNPLRSPPHPLKLLTCFLFP